MPSAAAAVHASKGNTWLFALGTAALLQIDPALIQVADLAAAVAAAGTQSAARSQVAQLRAHARGLNAKLSPMAARALSRVVRRAERASGNVLDKRARLKELQASWDELLACLQGSRR
jgi:hypothetical protein